MYERILVPLDGSSAAEEALPHAREIARRFGSRLILVRVVEPLMVPPLPTFAGPDVSILEHPGDAEAARAYLQERADALAQEGIATEVDVRHGAAADQILACARDHAVDLVVMSTQGRGGIMRLIGGSTTEAVLPRIHVPVLVVRPAPSAGP